MAVALPTVFHVEGGEEADDLGADRVVLGDQLAELRLDRSRLRRFPHCHMLSNVCTSTNSYFDIFRMFLPISGEADRVRRARASGGRPLDSAEQR